jgi:bifunctional DNA-binding transcriptional regulator/antitoxin component of YhaV-PrlF toxin-antitoxin module
METTTTSTDDQGRLYLPKSLRERHGTRYHVVEYEDRVELIPIAEDPLAEVRAAAGDLREEPADEILEAARNQAAADATDLGE